MNIQSTEELQAFSTLMNRLSKYYSRDINTETLQVMLSSLERFSLNDIKNACNMHVTSSENGRFMPKASDIISLIEGDLESKASAAWTKADKALRTRGPYKNISFKDPIIMLVIRDMGGWVKFCTKPNNDNYAFLEKDFKRRYKDYSMHPLPMDTPEELTGIEHQSNSQSHIQKNRIEEKTAQKIGHEEVMAKIRSFGLNVPSDQPKKKTGTKR